MSLIPTDQFNLLYRDDDLRIEPDVGYFQRYRAMRESLAAIGAHLFILHDEVEIVCPNEHHSEVISIYMQFIFNEHLLRAGDTVLKLPQVREPTWEELADLACDPGLLPLR